MVEPIVTRIREQGWVGAHVRGTGMGRSILIASFHHLTLTVTSSAAGVTSTEVKNMEENAGDRYCIWVDERTTPEIPSAELAMRVDAELFDVKDANDQPVRAHVLFNSVIGSGWCKPFMV